MRTQELEMVSQELTFPLTAVKLGRKLKYLMKTTPTRKKGNAKIYLVFKKMLVLRGLFGISSLRSQKTSRKTKLKSASAQ